MTLELNSIFDNSTTSSIDGYIEGIIAREVQSALANGTNQALIERLCMMLCSALANVTLSPMVDVQPANVSLASPTIDLDTSSLDDVAVRLEGIESLLRDLKTILSQPTIREIDRDQEGNITRMREYRGR